jgi:hypothetical protein
VESDDTFDGTWRLSRMFCVDFMELLNFDFDAFLIDTSYRATPFILFDIWIGVEM